MAQTSVNQETGGRPMISIEVVPDAQGSFVWGNGVAGIRFSASDDAPVCMTGLSGRGMIPVTDAAGQRDPRPIVEVLSSRDGNADNRLRLVMTKLGGRLRFVEAHAWEPCPTAGDAADSGTPGPLFADGLAAQGVAVYRLEIVQRDQETGVTAISVFEAFPGVSAVRGYTKLSSERRCPIEAVSSVSLTLPMDANNATVDSSVVLYGTSAWSAENDWHRVPVRETSVRDRNLRINPGESSSRFAQHSASTWSTGEYQPAGVLELHDAEGKANDNGGGEAACSVSWQIEHNGAWEWEIGENDPGLHLTVFGPEYEDHHWFTALGRRGDGELNDFTSVPVSFSVAAGDWQRAIAEMTVHRRCLRAAKAAELGRSAQLERMNSLVVYNDYMNTLFGDPRLDKELPLIEGAADVGADIFCIDAGWYDSTDGGWWDMVGEWLPSTNRFGEPGLGGLAEVIRNHGMGLGLWLEPEVIGVKSPLAKTLPERAFIRRHGERVVDQNRYLLDFRAPEAREHVTRTVDRLIADFGAVFFKFDYNTIPGTGTDENAESVGGGLLEHCRAYLDWLDDLRRRHPDVMIENCGSGAMRADWAQLSRLDLQSTSDQCDPLVYAAIAAGAGMTILPEQQGNWGYAQQEMDDETAVFTLAAGVLGRLYLSGFINRMDSRRRGLVRDAIALHRRVLAEQPDLAPWWPAGLPAFNDGWQVSGLLRYGNHAEDSSSVAVGGGDGVASDSRPLGYVTAWRRSGEPSVDVAIPEGARLVQVFPDPAMPDHAPEAVPWIVEQTGSASVRVTVADPTRPSARIFAVLQ